MSRRPNLIPSVQLTTMIPQDIHTRLSNFLFSDLEGRIPTGAFQQFIVARTREFFDSARLDLCPYTDALPGDFVVIGSPATITLLERLLERKDK